ncbi:MAG: hypothetical protein LM517_11160 [Nitrosomonas sp.]|nr:hypothetical protein [Nitrosomonas sp.]
MIKSYRQWIVLLLFTIAPITVFGVNLESIDGIWQDVDKAENYYAISQNGTAIVLVDLKRLAAGRDTFAATYTGTLKQDSLITPLAPYPDSPFDQIPLKINFISDTEATLLPDCDVCTGSGGTLKKIFK